MRLSMAFALSASLCLAYSARCSLDVFGRSGAGICLNFRIQPSRESSNSDGLRSENVESRGPFCRSVEGEEVLSGAWRSRLLDSLSFKSVKGRFLESFTAGGLGWFNISEMGETSRDDALTDEVILGGALDGKALSESFLAIAIFFARVLGADELGSGVGREALRLEDLALPVVSRSLACFMALPLTFLLLAVSTSSVAGILGPSSRLLGFSFTSGNGSTRFGGSIWLSGTLSVNRRSVHTRVCGALVGLAS